MPNWPSQKTLAIFTITSTLAAVIAIPVAVWQGINQEKSVRLQVQQINIDSAKSQEISVDYPVGPVRRCVTINGSAPHKGGYVVWSAHRDVEGANYFSTGRFM
ncbi:hypothetical protein [Micromonospora sp. Llam0]|uniref:hypothetical protein n=1 Tax=Micromonospora sp. Llam0 TaxID=2485143 RepID=UPI0011CDC5D2|nr:hypothetical protein [Micromonospora sp. Llam0]